MGRGRGRPNKEIDQEQFEKFCECQCTKEEISEFLDVNERTLRRWCKRTYGMTFEDVFRVKRKGGFISLRRSQYLSATEDRNPTMLIWLGKVWLGQTDKPSSDIAEPEISDEVEALLAELDEE